MDTTYHSNIPVETLSLLDCDVRNFDFGSLTLAHSQYSQMSFMYGFFSSNFYF